MIDALIGGRLHGSPAERAARNGKPFATAKVRVSTAAGESVFVSVIAFADSAVASLLALCDGESVYLAGELTPKVWTDREGVARCGLDLVAHAVLTTYHVSRKRQAVAETGRGHTEAVI